MQIRYDFGDREELIDGSILKDFIAFEGTKIYIDPDRVKDYVAELASAFVNKKVYHPANQIVYHL